MKKVVSILSFFLVIASIAVNAAISFSSTFVSGNFLQTGDAAVLIADSTGTGFDAGSVFSTSLGGSLDSGLNTANAATYGPGYEVLDTSNIQTNILGNEFLGFSVTNYVYDTGTPGALAEGDEFAVLVFSTDATTTELGQTYRLFTDNTWLMPADPGTYGSSDFNTATSDSTFGGTVVPEPSAFALLAGCFGLAWVMVRRRV